MNRLKDLRKEKNLTQTQLGEILGRSKSTISYWEMGRIEIDNESLFMLADYFDVTIDYLLGRSDIRKAKEEQLILSALNDEIKHMDDTKRKMLLEMVKILNGTE